MRYTYRLRPGVQAQTALLAEWHRCPASFTVTVGRHPKPKARKKTRPSLEYTKRGFSVRAGRLRLPDGVSIPVVSARGLPSEPTSVGVFQDSIGYLGHRKRWAAELGRAQEDFKATFLAKTAIARKAADPAIGAAKREVTERGTRADRTVVLVPPA